MSEVTFLNQAARRYAERQTSTDPVRRQLPELALRDIQACMELDHLGYVEDEAFDERRINTIERLGTEATMREIASFYGFPPYDIQEIYNNAYQRLEDAVTAEAR